MGDDSGVWQCWVEGRPVTFKRPAGGTWTTRGGRRVWRAHNDPEDMRWRATVRAAWLETYGALALTGPLGLHLSFYGPRLGDCSNLAKAVEDALQAGEWPDGLSPAYRDDHQITRLTVYRLPWHAGLVPGVAIVLSRLPRDR